LDRGHTIKKSQFVTALNSTPQKVDWKILKGLFGKEVEAEDYWSITEKLFDLLVKGDVLSPLPNSKDEYLVLNGFRYFTQIVEAIGGGDE
jgi:hypothetical protein